jgi:hypothetical protein
LVQQEAEVTHGWPKPIQQAPAMHVVRVAQAFTMQSLAVLQPQTPFTHPAPGEQAFALAWQSTQAPPVVPQDPAEVPFSH